MGRFRLFCILNFLTTASLCGQINISFMVTDAACLDGTILIMATGGSGSYQYEIVGNTCGLPNRSLQSSPEFRNLPPCTYTVLVLDGTGTSATRDVAVGGNYKEPSVTIKPDICGFTIDVINGKPPLRFALSTDGGKTYGPPSAQNVYSGLMAGTYDIRVNDSCGYVIHKKVILPPDTLTYRFDRVQRNQVDSIVAVVTSGGQGPFRFYIVNGMDTLSSTYNTFALKDILLSCSTKVVIETACGRSLQDFHWTDSATAGGPKDVIRVQRTDTICAGSRLVVGPSEYRMSGEYLDTLKTMGGCDSLVLTRLTVDPPLAFDLEALHPLCSGQDNGSISVSGLTGYSPHSFLLNGRSFQGPKAGQLTGGNYVVKITDGHGCSAEKNIRLIEPAKIEFEAGEDSLLQPGESIVLKVKTNLGKDEIKSIKWFADPDILCSHCETLTLSPTKTQKIRAELLSQEGCTAEDAFTLRLHSGFRVFAPNILKIPSSDGSERNARFTLYGPQIETIEYLRIFDRYGSLVYEIKESVPGDWTGGWDGYTGQKPAPPGAYIYVARVRFADESRQVLRGDVTVIR